MSYHHPYWLNEDELEHFGTKGMKWGIRRYQNADGTLTEAGKNPVKTLDSNKVSIGTKIINAILKLFKKK